ncbi:MAG: hypothetical protein M3O82_01880 [Verrucomicrobiota bacterium]|nr:hypothetical protein [Verrucomicrobiota bacterium]
MELARIIQAIADPVLLLYAIAIFCLLASAAVEERRQARGARFDVRNIKRRTLPRESEVRL